MSTISEAFAATCEEQALWREKVYDERGDDRNLKTAHALRAAATWATTDENAEATLSELLPGDIESGTGFLLLSTESRRIFSTFCFHRPEQLDRWLRRVADAQYDEEFDDELDELLGGDQ